MVLHSGTSSSASHLGVSQPDRRVRPSTPDDGPAIVALMKEAGLEPHCDPQHLNWKYWQTREDWHGPRSFVLIDGQTLLAHVALMPGTLRWGQSGSRVIHMIDWAARRDAVGAGVVLMNHVGRQADLLLSIGGSDMTRRIMPLIGYRLCGEVTGYVRPLSPVRLLGRSRGPRWRLGPRLARSAAWALAAPSPDPGPCLTHPIGAKDVEQLSAVLPIAGLSLAVLDRSSAQFRYALSCPIAPFELHAIEQRRHVSGYFALSYVPGQARLADLWMDSSDPADWRVLVHSAVREARAKGGLAEITAWANDPGLSGVLKGCGFHPRFTMPIYLRASTAGIVPKQTLRVQMLDSDAFYLYSSQDELWA